MKKILTLLLTLCLLVGLAPMAFAAGDVVPYISVLQTATQQYPSPYFGEGMLCDLNGDGSDELVLFCLDEQSQAVAEVYTISGGKAVQALSPAPVYAQAGSSEGYVAQATRDGKTYLLTFSSEDAFTETTIIKTVTVKLYKMRGQTLSLDTQLGCTETTYIGPEGSNAEPYLVEAETFSVINGERKSYADFETAMESIQLPMWNLGFTDGGYDDDAAPLKTLLNEVSTGFDDVPATAYYAQPVIWAAENGITTGTSATNFSPSASCTRAQFVTFLWRAKGSPAPESTKNPFTDVKAGAYYYDAVLWAVEQGVTTGTSAAKFSPNATLTRAQTATFLWRLAGSPKPSKSGGFTDVKSTAYYADAVAWAAEHGITTGTSDTTFSPNQTCTRAQTVTFLYRDLAS